MKFPEMPKMPDMPEMPKMPKMPDISEINEVTPLGRITSDVQYNSGVTAVRVVRYSSGLIRAWVNGREISVSQYSLQKATEEAKNYRTTIRGRVPHAGEYEYDRFSSHSQFTNRSDQPVYKPFSELKKIWRAMKNSKRVSRGDKKDE